mgnify:CR=1 FL=1
MAWQSPGLEWRLTTPVKMVTDHNVLLMRCLAASSQALQVRDLYVRTSNACLFNLNRVGAATGAGTSACVVTPIFGIVGGGSGAAWTAYGKAYYGTTTVVSGIGASGATSVTWAQIDAGKGGTVVDDVLLQPGQCLVLRANPSAKGYVQATCKVRAVPLGEYLP